MTFTPDHSYADAPPWDILIHPGGPGTEDLAKNEEHLNWLREQRSVVSIMASVCTGSLVLAAAGLLTNRPATSHQEAIDLLEVSDPTIQVEYDARFVDDGDVITSAGVSAGIDMALHLVKRLASPDRAESIREQIQYAP